MIEALSKKKGKFILPIRKMPRTLNILHLKIYHTFCRKCELVLNYGTTEYGRWVSSSARGLHLQEPFGWRYTWCLSAVSAVFPEKLGGVTQSSCMKLLSTIMNSEGVIHRRVKGKEDDNINEWAGMMTANSEDSEVIAYFGPITIGRSRSRSFFTRGANYLATRPPSKDESPHVCG